MRFLIKQSTKLIMLIAITILILHIIIFFFLITVPPHKPNIVDEHGNTVTTVAGVYKEGSNMRLTCLVSGGKLTCFYPTHTHV